MMKIAHKDLGKLVLRLGVAMVFINHGLMKLMNAEGSLKFFASLHLPMPVFYFVCAVEVLGGLAVLLGLWTKWAGYILAINMLVAALITTSPRGIFGHELEIFLMLMSLAVALLGAGRLSVWPKKCGGNCQCGSKDMAMGCSGDCANGGCANCKPEAK